MAFPLPSGLAPYAWLGGKPPQLRTPLAGPRARSGSGGRQGVLGLSGQGGEGLAVVISDLG
ncbi:MAG: hypothetical protein WCF05_11480, partial [Chromatiaceae bacterium]